VGTRPERVRCSGRIYAPMRTEAATQSVVFKQRFVRRLGTLRAGRGRRLVTTCSAVLKFGRRALVSADIHRVYQEDLAQRLHLMRIDYPAEYETPDDREDFVTTIMNVQLGLARRTGARSSSVRPVIYRRHTGQGREGWTSTIETPEPCRPSTCIER
jgi:hypothetical protein